MIQLLKQGSYYFQPTQSATLMLHYYRAYGIQTSKLDKSLWVQPRSLSDLSFGYLCGPTTAGFYDRFRLLSSGNLNHFNIDIRNCGDEFLKNGGDSKLKGCVQL